MHSNLNKILRTLCVMVVSAHVSADNRSSNLAPDERIEFITGAAWLDVSGEHWNVPVRVWVYEPQNSTVRKRLIATALKNKYGLSVTPASRKNFSRRVNYLIADNERGKEIVIALAGKQYELNKTDARGHSETLIAVPLADAPEQASSLHYQAVLPEEDARVFQGHSLLVAPRGISILSDIDDTVKVSQVTDRAKLFDNTFYQNFTSVPGMSEVYADLEAKGASLHFVSSSPWQLYPELNSFLDREGFAPRSIALKTLRFKDRSFFNLFKSGAETKPQQIRPLFERFPQRKFILIGDSGEEDAQVYAKFLQDYPEQVLAVFIRRLNNEDKAGWNAIPRENFFYFEDPNEILRYLGNRISY